MSSFLRSQPRGMWTLCFAELCDRLAFYGILSTLVIYLTNHFHLRDAQAYAIFGIYTTLGFATPVIGGFVTDYILGASRSVVIGGFLIVLGCLILEEGQLTEFYLGVSVVITGIGLFKAAATSQFGLLYGEDSASKNAGYTLFYMGMNVGAILGPILFGIFALGHRYQVGYTYSALVMLASVCLYLCQYRYFYKHSKTKVQIQNRFWLWFAAFVGVFAMVAGIDELFQNAGYFGDILIPFGIGILALIALLAFIKKDRQTRLNIFQLLLLTLLSIFYFACAKQTESSLMLFINRNVNHSLFGWDLPTVAFASIKPLFIIGFAMAFAPLWQWYCKKHKTPHVTFMVTCGLALGAISFVVFALSAQMTQTTGFNWPLAGILLGLFLLGVGELCIIPAVTAAMSNLAPKDYQTTFMGIWFLSLAFSGYMASLIAKMNISPEVARASIHNFVATFWGIAELTAAVTVVSFVIWLLFRARYLNAAAKKHARLTEV